MTAVRLGRQNPALLPLLEEYRVKVREAFRRINTRFPPKVGADIITHIEYVKLMPFVSETWKKILSIEAREEVLVNEANEIVLRWHHELEAIFASVNQ
jgi:predicted metal-dependent RNase